LDRLVDLASQVLSQRSDFQTNLLDDLDGTALKQILQVGTSAGGARAKAVIAWHPATGEVRSGQVKAPEGFEYWLLKFDGVSSNRDKELDDPKGYGAVEYAYHLMAVSAGIDMSVCRLLEENGRRHFMTRRFDRTPEGQKLHMQSLGALVHADYNSAGAYSYEQAFGILRTLGLGLDAVERLYRRMAFSILARNQDDHVKNIAFLMDQQGRWRLAPAFDLTWSYQPQGLWTATHQMTLNGRRDAFVLDDFKDAARDAGMKRGRAGSILGEVSAAIARWPEFAEAAAVPAAQISGIQKTFRAIR
jgi:serine/threonine-protein kinase HipA